MKERPILFSAPMVRALLAGTKTQTRRVMKPQPYPNGHHFDGRDILCHNDYLPPSALLLDVGRGRNRVTWSDVEDDLAQACPYGVPGDRLWVREAWARTVVGTGATMVVYREGDNRTDYGGPWKPGIHLFRRDSRITLEVTGVRVERLQDISEADAIAEGCITEQVVSDYDGSVIKVPSEIPHPSGVGSQGWDTARDWYADLWESINGPDSWDANPWVWVVQF